MRKKWIYLLLIVISTMLVVLIIIQVLWLSGASRADKREKQIRVNAALSRVSEQVRDNSSCFETYGKVYVDVGERFFYVTYPEEREGRHNRYIF
jgi:flagellar basal body-associated protein FliL